MKNTLLTLVSVFTLSVLSGCGSSSSGSNPSDSSQAISSPMGASSSMATSSSPAVTSSSSAAALNDYAFSVNDVDTVAYAGQTVRQVMIEDIKTVIGAMTKGADTGITEQLKTLFENPSNSQDGNSILLKAGDFSLAQSTYADISTGKNLQGKIAGGFVVDGVPAGETSRLISEFIGTAMPAGALPVDYVNALFERLGELAAAPNHVSVSVAGELQAVTAPYVSAEGVDYQQLVQKFLLMAVGFSQGVNDYLSPARNFGDELAIEDSPYSTAEHHFDEGFGYFGAIPTYGNYSDEEISSSAYFDEDANGVIDLTREFNFGQSINCAKRDLATASNAKPTDFTGEAFDAFKAGRTIVAQATAAGTLTPEQEAALDMQLAKASLAWEKCIASTVVHYINEVKSDIATFNGTNYADVNNFTDLAKHWAEMKGFALGLQFSPYSPFRTETGALAQISYGNQTATLANLLNWMGSAPVLAGATDIQKTQYVADLNAARDVLQAAYSFDAANVASW